MRTSRRAILASLPSVGVGGCTSVLGGDESSQLGQIQILNRHSEAHTIDVEVEWDDGIVHESTHQMQANEDEGLPYVEIDQTWPDSPGQFTVSGRMQGGEWKTARPEDRDYPDCFSVVLEVLREGVLVASKTTNPHQC